MYLEGRRLLEICDEKDLCVANTWYKKTDKQKVTHSSGGNVTEINFVLVEKNRKLIKRCEGNPVGVTAPIGDHRY